MLVFLAVTVVFILFVIITFNALISRKNQVLNVFSTVDVMLKKRFDLVPNLIAAVKGYMNHERGLLEKITKLRSQAAGPNLTQDQRIALDNQLGALLGQVMLAIENYPDLKASENFMHLQRSLTELEEQISATRRAYNAAVNDYNNAVEMFPTNMIASMINYKRKVFFEIPKAERQAPDASKMSSNNN